MVIHGRNEQARQAMFTFLRALDLLPIEWEQAVSETGKGSPHTLEAVRAAMRLSQAVIVLLTGEDEARLLADLASADEERDLRPQPRPNVLLEAGMALATDPDRTIFTQLGPLRTASDLEGLNYIQLSNAPAARSALRRRLLDAGCETSDAVGPAWMSAEGGGDFDAAILRRSFRTGLPVKPPLPAAPPSSANRKGQWDERSFFAALEENGGPEATAVARRVLDWSREQHLRIGWGRGRAEGSLTPALSARGTTYSLATVYTYAKLEFNFQALRTRPPYDDDAKRLDLLRRLNQISGVDLPADSIDRRPSVYLTDIARDESITRLLQVWEDLNDEVRSNR